MTSPTSPVPGAINQINIDPVGDTSRNQNVGQLNSRKVKSLNCCAISCCVLLITSIASLALLLIVPFTVTLTGLVLANSSSNSTSDLEQKTLGRGMIIGGGTSLLGNFVVTLCTLFALKIGELLYRS